ncbi:MAG: tyrosinase family protein [Bacteroidia bacterium]|nr:tyrosinase family protein [Bacteroidia bacterium]
MNLDQNSEPSSYEKVKQILDKAAEGTTADYQGYKNFWSSLSLDKLQEISIYGVRMIAPIDESDCGDMLLSKPPESSCCSSHEDEEKEDEIDMLEKGWERIDGLSKPPYPGRGAASGLIKGLRGEFPFDGNSFQGDENREGHFPRLPWGGKEVSEKDIQFISDWIDYGCSPDDNIPDRHGAGHKGKYQINLQLTDAYKPRLKQRKNLKSLTEEEIYRLRCATLELKKLNKWPRDRRSLYSWGKLHGNVCEHGWEQFLTWHRMFLYEFEQTLQDFDETVTLPYWDWTDPDYNNGAIPKENKEFPKKPISSIIPEIYRCWINDVAIENLSKLGDEWKPVLEKLEKIKGIKFNSGVELFYMADIEGDEYYKFSPKIIEQLELINPLWYPLRYPGMFYQMNNGKFVRDKNGDPIPILKNGLQNPFHHHYPTAEDVVKILQVDNWRDFAGGPEYNQSFGVLDMDPHNTIHIWVGGYNKNFQEGNELEPFNGDMLANLTAGFDPIFWPHHVYIDRLFSIWQRNNPNQLPYNVNGALAGLGYSVRDALNIEQLGYEYAHAGHVFQIEHPKGVSVFKSDYINFDARLYQTQGLKGKVELRLHEVVQPENSFVVRVFLNSPDADMFTPATEENKFYAGCIFFWGHGRCVGGPGHCAPPPENKRDNDKRPPNHNARRNYRLDITEAVQRLSQEGVDEFQVNLVVVGPDGSDCENGFFPKAIEVVES